ncbi:hypothetical protein ACFLVG_00750 [Chloroflexota bacterium]
MLKNGLFYIEEVLNHFGALMVVAMMALIAAAVIARNAFNTSFPQ